MNTEEAIKILSNYGVYSRWIPCSERLPKNDDDVIVSDTVGHVEFGFYDNGTWYDCDGNRYGEQSEVFNVKVLAWMPFPKPYEDNYGFSSKEEADLWMDGKPVGKEEI